MTAFQVFRQYERLFQDQSQDLETQQNLRAVLFQINDGIRRAGQGVPLYAAAGDSGAGENLAVVLAGSDGSHLRIREGYNSVESSVLTTPATYMIGSSRTITVNDALSF